MLTELEYAVSTAIDLARDPHDDGNISAQLFVAALQENGFKIVRTEKQKAPSTE